MTGEGLKSALLELGWSGRHLASRVGVHPNTVTSWVRGRAEVPGPVVAYLGLATAVVGLAKLLEKPRPRRRARGSGGFLKRRQ